MRHPDVFADEKEGDGARDGTDADDIADVGGGKTVFLEPELAEVLPKANRDAEKGEHGEDLVFKALVFREFAAMFGEFWMFFGPVRVFLGPIADDWVLPRGLAPSRVLRETIFSDGALFGFSESSRLRLLAGLGYFRGFGFWSFCDFLSRSSLFGFLSERSGVAEDNAARSRGGFSTGNFARCRGFGSSFRSFGVLIHSFYFSISD